MTSPSVGARPCPPPPEGAIRTEIPTLVTERLILRAPGPEDFEPFAAFYASERASMVGGPESRRDAWAGWPPSSVIGICAAMGSGP